MKKIGLFSIFYLLILHLVIAQEKQTYGTLLKIDGQYYVETNGISYLADTSVVTVKYKSDFLQSSLILDTIRSNKLGFIDVIVPAGINLADFVSMLKNTNDFEYVDYNSFGELCDIPNDSLLSDQWHIPFVNTNDAWAVTTGAPTVKVAILDTGIDWTHPDLGYGNDNYKNIDETLGWNFLDNNNNVLPPTDSEKHGTKVAGVIGAKTNNTIGIAGISGGNGQSPGVTIIPIRVCNNHSTNDAIVDDAIIYAVDNGARIINMSFAAGS